VKKNRGWALPPWDGGVVDPGNTLLPMYYDTNFAPCDKTCLTLLKHDCPHITVMGNLPGGPK